jgi:5-methylcytosine-specific restriction enzyme A
MPRRPRRPCTKPGCRALVEGGGRCPEHPYPPRFRGEVERESDARRGGARTRGYDSTWERLRKLKLANDPLCEACLSVGVIEAADTVDHVTPLRDGGPRLEMGNLQSLSRICHARKTAAETKARR